jgi:uncharacterized protein YjeT (DUF2065 family)
MSDITIAEWLIRLTTAITMMAFGLHQIMYPKKWKEYIPAWFPLPASPFLQTHGVGNVLLGLLFAIGFWPVVFDWVVLAWWVSILAFAFRVQWSIGLRDLIIIAGIMAMILITHG